MVIIGIKAGVSLLLPIDFNKVNAYAQHNSSSTIHNSTDNTISNNSTIITVSGMASTNVKPDKVTLSLGIQTTNKTANAALIANSKLMNRVIDRLKSTGVKDNETSTSSFSISPNYSLVGTKENITGITVNNFIKLDSSNTTNVSKWVDSSIAAGATSINDIYFSLSDKKLVETKNTLIKNAISDALRKAVIAASTIGQRVIGLSSINLDVPVFNMPLSARLASPQAASASNPISPPVMPGERQVSQEVSIVVKLGK
jgi:uncharacterized protein